MCDEKPNRTSHRPMPFVARSVAKTSGDGVWYGIPYGPTVYLSIVRSADKEPVVLTGRLPKGFMQPRICSCDSSLAAGCGTHATCRLVCLGGVQSLCLEQVQMIRGVPIADTVLEQGVAFAELCEAFGTAPGLDVYLTAPTVLRRPTDAIKHKNVQIMFGGLSPGANIGTLTNWEPTRLCWVEASTDHDTYMLYAEERNGNRIGVADLPSYEDSIRLNSLFRNVRENTNLDWAEDSEDEDVFEDISAEKWIRVGSRLPMVCVKHRGRRGWTPIEVAHSSSIHLYQKPNETIRPSSFCQQRKLRKGKGTPRKLSKSRRPLHNNAVR